MMKRKPEWLRVRIQGGTETNKVKTLLRDLSLNTVCQEANCPNQMECYNRRTATFMILGRNCTRNCTFCNVTKKEPDPIDLSEPKHIGEAVKRLSLRHAVITSVTRDDLTDGGASQFSAVVSEIRKNSPNTTVELLIPDLQGNWDALSLVMASNPDILNHNIETVPSLYERVRPMANYAQSLELLKRAKALNPQVQTKSGIMLGLGETREELLNTFQDLLNNGCELLTLGQYLPPSDQHIEVTEFIHPDTFIELKKIALEMGFKNVASAPLVRSSYHADELIEKTK